MNGEAVWVSCKKGMGKVFYRVCDGDFLDDSCIYPAWGFLYDSDASVLSLS